MKLGEFISNFSHNNLIRLLYKDKGGHKLVLSNWDDVSMDHEVNNNKGKFRHYINNEVLGLAGIYLDSSVGGGNYPEAINIVIEELDDQPFIEQVSEISEHFESC